MSIEVFKLKLANSMAEISFSESIALIDNIYEFTPVSFRNGELLNAENQNNGSCKLFYFGKLNRLTMDEMLACFGDFYRVDVLGNPAGDDHLNIRNFMKTGWEGIEYFGIALRLKK